MKPELFPGDLGAGLEPPKPALVVTEALDDCALRLIGHSPGIQKVRDLISRVAPTDSTVLICGESGCGKSS
jgi:DNA-binding NtrC family response regulator